MLGMKRTTNFGTTLVAVCGLALPSAAIAQEAKEWSREEGVHAEEWYDPTDWFDDDFDGKDYTDTDVETDWWQQEPYEGIEDDADYWRSDDDDYVYSYGYDWYVDDYNTLYVDGYYDGYVDGYGDDEFGYDDDYVYDMTSSKYTDGFIEGYYDGFYDSARGFGSDWTYYIYSTPVMNERDQRERRGDEDRSRGDRAEAAGTDEMSKSDARKSAKATDSSRVRGTVKKVERMKSSKLPDTMEGHTVVRVTFDDGKRAVVDLGPEVDRKMISVDDRVTIVGKRIKRDGRSMLDATRLSVNDEIMWNARENGMPKDRVDG